MSEKIALTPKRTLTRSTTSNPVEDQYTFQSDDDDHQVKETLLRKRPRGRPPKTPSISSTNSETDEPTKRSYEKPVTRRASRLGSQTNTTRDKIKINSTPPILITPKKRGRKPKTDSTTKTESENRLPTNKDDMNTTNNNNTTSVVNEKIEEKDLMQFGSPEQDDFSDDSVDFVWKGSSKLSIEILKRRLPKDDGRDLSSIHSDPTAQRKRAMIPRLTNFDALSGKPMMEKSRPRVYAVKSTMMKPRQPSPNDIKRPKWMDEQTNKSDQDEFRNRRTTTNFTPGLRGRPPGSRRQWNPDDEDEDYDQYEENNTRYYSSKRPIPPNRSSAVGTRPIYDDEVDDLNKAPRMSLTQTYRRNSDGRQQPINNVNRRIPINNGIYKNENYYSQGTTTNNSATTINTGNTFVAKINDAQLSEVANQSQIFFVNVPQQDQKNHQVLSVLASEQQQVLPVAVVQQAKVETPTSNTTTSQNQTLAFTVKLPVDAPKQKKILPKPSPSSNNSSINPNASNSNTSTQQKPFAWSRPPGRVSLNHDDQSIGKGALTITPINTDLDTMEAAHVLATAADVTMAADARRKAQQQDDDMHMMVDETPSNIANEETVQCEDEGQKSQPPIGSITANIIDENGLEHTVLLSTEEAQQLLGAQGAILVDTDGQPISLQPTQTFLSPFALDQAQLQALLTQAGIDPNTPLTIEQIDPNQQQSATLCTSPGGTQYTVLTQAAPTQQQFILQPAPAPAPLPPPIQPAPIAPKEELTSPPKRRAFAVKSTTTTTPAEENFDEINSNDRPRRKIFATKSTVTTMDQN